MEAFLVNIGVPRSVQYGFNILIMVVPPATAALVPI